jgi:hypothetical protein
MRVDENIFELDILDFYPDANVLDHLDDEEMENFEEVKTNTPVLLNKMTSLFSGMDYFNI